MVFIDLTFRLDAEICAILPSLLHDLIVMDFHDKLNFMYLSNGWVFKAIKKRWANA